MWQGRVRYAPSTTPLSIQQEYSTLISPQHISEVAPSITFYLYYRGKEIGDTLEKWCPSQESNLGPSKNTPATTGVVAPVAGGTVAAGGKGAVTKTPPVMAAKQGSKAKAKKH